LRSGLSCRGLLDRDRLVERWRSVQRHGQHR
jgi:hypothetical protein